jgi:3'(2'), 5'-bisphosphate nucleotidase
VTPDARALDELVRIAALGCDVVRRHYATEFRVDYKSGDDPVTSADRESNEVLCRELERAFPGVPVVAEESDASTFDVRRDAAECFFVDPLDGTREFVARNGEFAVMIGLGRRGRAALGVVAAPESRRTFAGGPTVPSFEIAADGARRAIAPRDVGARDARAVVSRSRTTQQTLDALARLGVARVDKMGSAGLKAVAVACGEADLWVQCGQAGMVWDGCGPEAIVLGAGASYGQRGGAPPDYAGGPLDLRDLVVAANRSLFDDALAAVAALAV